MIKLKDLLLEILAERMSYQDLMNSSDPKRKDRASRIPSKSLAVKSINDKEAWKFSYKTPKNENTTGLRHQGFIYFFKDNIEPGDNAMKIDCSVDCSCPDYKYRFSYANKSVDAGQNGTNSLNKGLNYPSSINAGPGLCKHLISLKEYLKTKIEGEPEVPNEPEKGIEPKAYPKTPTKGTVPDEEPEAEPEVPETPTTQTPEPVDQEKEIEPEPSAMEDPTQTPQGPENNEEEPEEENPEKLKESLNEKSQIIKTLNDICKNSRIFILRYD